MVSAPTAYTIVMILAICILVLQQAGWGPCRKCRKAHREPTCRYCEISESGDGDIRKPRFTDPLSRKRRGED